MAVLKFLKKHLLLIIIVLIAAGGVFYYYRSTHKNTAQQQMSTVVARRGNISVTVTGSGPVQPIKTANILAQVASTVLKVNVSEGDRVKAGDVLCVLDSSSFNNNIKNSQLQLEQAKLNLQSAQNNYNNLTIRAPISGYVTNLSIQKGSNVGSNMVIATIQDTSYLTVTAPFSETVADSMNVGDTAYAVLTDGSLSVTGSISHIGPSYAYKNGVVARDVTIKFANPGDVKLNSNMNIYINVLNGKVYSLAPGQLQPINVVNVQAQVPGTVSTLNVSQGDYVNKGAVMAILSSDNVAQNLEQAKIQYEMAQNNYNVQQSTLNNYVIKAPFDGIVASVSVNPGDVVKEGQQIVTIADTSGMKFTIPVDELDISNVKVGQNVAVTLDAIQGKTYTGKVSRVAEQGTSQNGVTTYDVDITIDNPTGIKLGMNANAEIEVASAKNVIVLPQSAIIKLGGRNFVIEKKNIPANFDITRLAAFVRQISSSSNTTNGSNGFSFFNRANGANDFGSNFSVRNTSGNRNRNNSNYRRIGSGVSFRNLLTPVEIGLSDNNMVEIKSGLDEGTEVVLPLSLTTNNNSNSTQNSQRAYGGEGFGGGFMVRQFNPGR